MPPTTSRPPLFTRISLALLGGLVALLGAALSTSCAVAYGPRPPDCSKDSDCVSAHGAGWYCESGTYCTPVPDGGVDGGTRDAQ